MELKRQMMRAIDSGADYMDIRYEKEQSTVIEIRDGVLREAKVGFELGAGIRVLLDGSWGFYATSDLSNLEEGITKALKLAKAHKSDKDLKLAPSDPTDEDFKLKVKESLEDVGIDRKISLVREAYKSLVGVDERIKSASVYYSDSIIEKTFLNSEGSEIRLHLPYISIGFRAVASAGGELQEAHDRAGAFTGFELSKENDPGEIAMNVSRRALRLLDAKNPPAGNLPVVMDGKLLGIFAHEALGHTAEADLVVSGESILADKIESRIASEIITIADDPSIQYTHGYYPFDDEGVRSRRTLIIENGTLRSYLQTRSSAGELGMDLTANARAEDNSHIPIARMSNIIIERGDQSFDEMIEGIKMGIYAKGMRGGQVDTVGGNFQFTAEEAFLIEDGEVKGPIRNLSLAGRTLEVLEKIDALGKDVTGSIGFCGKNGQTVPVSESGPHAMISEILVGGNDA